MFGLTSFKKDIEAFKTHHSQQLVSETNFPNIYTLEFHWCTLNIAAPTKLFQPTTINLHIFGYYTTQTKYRNWLSSGIIYGFPKVFLKITEAVTFIDFIKRTKIIESNDTIHMQQKKIYERKAFVAGIFIACFFFRSLSEMGRKLHWTWKSNSGMTNKMRYIQNSTHPNSCRWNFVLLFITMIHTHRCTFCLPFTVKCLQFLSTI